VDKTFKSKVPREGERDIYYNTKFAYIRTIQGGVNVERLFFRSGIVERKEHAGELKNSDVKRDAHVISR